MMNIPNMSLHICSSPNVNRPENDKDDWLLVVFVIGIIVFITSCISFFILYYYRKRKSEFFKINNICISVCLYRSRFSLSNIFSVMLECFSDKRSTSNERALIELEELEERESLISDTENEKRFCNKSEYNIVIILPYGVLFFFLMYEAIWQKVRYLYNWKIIIIYSVALPLFTYQL